MATDVSAQLHAIDGSTDITAAEYVSEIARRKLIRRLTFLQSEPQTDTPAAERLWQLQHPDHELAAFIAGLNEMENSPRRAIIETLGLSPQETAVLDFCVAFAVDPEIEGLVSRLQNPSWRVLPGEALIKRLYDLPAQPIWRSTSVLARWQLIHACDVNAAGTPGLKADPCMIDWYFGKAALGFGLAGLCTLPPSQKEPPSWDINRDVNNIDTLLTSHGSLRVNISGPGGSGRKNMAVLICESLGRNGLWIRSFALPEGRDDLYVSLQRFCLLTNRIPIWCGAPVDWPDHLASVPLQIITHDAAHSPPPAHTPEYYMTQPVLTPQSRTAMWTTMTDADVSQLPPDLKSATYDELSLLADVTTNRDALIPHIIDQKNRAALAAIGTLIEPVISWDDLIVTPDLITDLKAFAFEARSRDKLLEDPETLRIYRQDTSLSALFTGPPGVGKTMAAQCIASELGLPLLIVDVSRTVSKFIGETAKNLSRIFDCARTYGCVLFFDEADAYFSSRTELKDSHDRHANADTNHLLQLLESYDGTLILATNQRANIDNAFFRRIRHCLTFRNPDARERHILWTRFADILFTKANTERHAETLQNCAQRFELTPAQIKSAVLNARYAGLRDDQPIQARHIWQGVAQELGKEGRTLPTSLKRVMMEAANVT